MRPLLKHCYFLTNTQGLYRGGLRPEFNKINNLLNRWDALFAVLAFLFSQQKPDKCSVRFKCHHFRKWRGVLPIISTNPVQHCFLWSGECEVIPHLVSSPDRQRLLPGYCLTLPLSCHPANNTALKGGTPYMKATFPFWFKNYCIAHLFSQRYPMNSGTAAFEPSPE